MIVASRSQNFRYLVGYPGTGFPRYPFCDHVPSSPGVTSPGSCLLIVASRSRNFRYLVWLPRSRVSPLPFLRSADQVPGFPGTFLCMMTRHLATFLLPQPDLHFPGICGLPPEIDPPVASGVSPHLPSILRPEGSYGNSTFLRPDPGKSRYLTHPFPHVTAGSR